MIEWVADSLGDVFRSGPWALLGIIRTARLVPAVELQKASEIRHTYRYWRPMGSSCATMRQRLGYVCEGFRLRMGFVGYATSDYAVCVYASF